MADALSPLDLLGAATWRHRVRCPCYPAARWAGPTQVGLKPHNATRPPLASGSDQRQGRPSHETPGLWDGESEYTAWSVEIAPRPATSRRQSLAAATCGKFSRRCRWAWCSIPRRVVRCYTYDADVALGGLDRAMIEARVKSERRRQRVERESLAETARRAVRVADCGCPEPEDYLQRPLESAHRCPNPIPR